jgi:hypothetical protein
MSLRAYLVNALGASCDACPAGNTGIFLVHDLKLAEESFRVRAPPAAQGATFQEDQRSHTRSIVHIILLYIEDGRFSFKLIPVLAAHVDELLSYPFSVA